jgi:uncharacterized protein YcbX
MPVTIAAIHRYPVKGLGPDVMDRAALQPGETLADDRRYALAHGASKFDPQAPEWLPKAHFAMLLRNARLAELRSSYDADEGRLRLLRGGTVMAEGLLEDAAGRRILGDYLDNLLGDEARGGIDVVSAPGVSFSDVPGNWISLINRESCEAIAAAAGAPVDPVRFRGNLIVEGLAAWAEFDWVGGEIAVGSARLRVLERIGRCGATEVDPASGTRDLPVPDLLRRRFGHCDCGVYMEVMEAGEIRPGDEIVTL